MASFSYDNSDIVPETPPDQINSTKWRRNRFLESSEDDEVKVKQSNILIYKEENLLRLNIDKYIPLFFTSIKFWILFAGK